MKQKALRVGDAHSFCYCSQYNVIKLTFNQEVNSYRTNYRWALVEQFYRYVYDLLMKESTTKRQIANLSQNGL